MRSEKLLSGSRWIWVALLMVVMTLSGTAHAQNILVNGGFETPVLNPGETTRPEISAWGVLGTAYTAQAGAGLPDAREGSQYLMAIRRISMYSRMPGPSRPAPTTS